MATTTEKIIGSLAGSIAGGLLMNEYIKTKDLQKEEHLKYQLGGALAGFLLGYLIALWLGSPNDTVNYKLLNGKKVVYHGITYTDRISMRKLEHQVGGKLFKKMIVDVAKPRCEALVLEKNLIKQDRPFYNKTHNC